MADVVTIGESMARLTSPIVAPLRLAPHLSLSIAGAESNLAIGLSRLGTSATWMSRLSSDEFGGLIASTLRGEGVKVSATIDEHAPTGLLIKNRRTSSRTDVAYYRAGSAASRLSPADIDATTIASAHILHLTGITPALSDTARSACLAAIQVARAHGVTVSFDLNMRRKLWTEDVARPALREIAGLADIVIASPDEARIVTDGADESELARNLAALGPREVVIKLGAEGALALVDGREHRSPVYRVVEIDPVGAGDAFCAGYLHGTARELAAEAKLDIAARCGAFAVSSEGDWEGLPTQNDLDLMSSADVVR